MAKETFIFDDGPLSVIQDRIEKAGRFNHRLHERVGKEVLLYNEIGVLSRTLQEKTRN